MATTVQAITIHEPSSAPPVNDLASWSPHVSLPRTIGAATARAAAIRMLTPRFSGSVADQPSNNMTTALTDLPPRIITAVKDAGFESSYRLAAKTTVKPNETIPTLWIVCTESHLLLCNTHRTRGIYRRYVWSEVNDVRRMSSASPGACVELIHNALDQANEIFPLDASVTSAQTDELVTFCKSRIGASKSS